MEGKFPCRHSFGDIVKFKYRGHGIVAEHHIIEE
jgi:hypothetical protein